MFHRLINISKSNSFFLFGARGVGKSTLLDGLFKPDDRILIDLLDPELANELISYPNNLLSLLKPHEGKIEWVVIDEVQKAPILLDIAHKLIKDKKFKFALTGSSARKLKKGSANLLAGRAFVYNLFPLAENEINDRFNLIEVLKYGSLPEIFQIENNKDKAKFLKSYALTYLKEEIISEQIVRNLPPFRRFLEVSAHNDTNTLNYSNIAKDINSDPKTVSNYYDILEDTLLGFRLPAFHHSIRKQQKLAPKFYFFDTGVVRALAGKVDYDLNEKDFEYGLLFENFIINEIHRQLTYLDQQFKLSFIRIDENLEIDLVIERGTMPTILIEIKSSNKIDERSAKNLTTLGKDIKNSKKYILSNDPIEKEFSEISALYWKDGIKKIVLEK